MKFTNLKTYLCEVLFKSKNEKHFKLTVAFTVSALMLTVYYLSAPNDIQSSKVTHENSVNLNVLIPSGYVLLPFIAENYIETEPFLEPYNMVRVINTKTGKLIARNIKLLRAPKDPSRLSFLVPENIAKKFINFGLEFKIVIQKYEHDLEPQLVAHHKKRIQKTDVSFGGIEE